MTRAEQDVVRSDMKECAFCGARRLIVVDCGAFGVRCPECVPWPNEEPNQ